MDNSTSAWTDCCRCCLKTPAEQQHQQLRAPCYDEIDGLDINNYLTYSTFLDATMAHDSEERLEDTIDDEYTPPASICSECLRELRNAMAFSELCRRSHRVLRERWLHHRQQLHMTYEVLDDSADGKIEEELFEESLEVDNEPLDDEATAENEADAFEVNADVSSVYEATQWLLDEVDEAGNVITDTDIAVATVEETAAVASFTSADQLHQGNGIQLTFACSGCNIEFNNEALWRKHVTWCDSSPTDNTCMECGQSCESAAALRGHRRDAHSIESTVDDVDAGDGVAEKIGNLFQCDYCGKWHSSKRALVWHMRNFHMSPPHKADHLCATCGKGFRTAQRLRLHTLTHTGERSHGCDLCTWTFATEFRLRAHRRTHTGERPYHCSVCGQMFAQSNALKCHMRTHTGERPYRCPVCAKCFTQNTILKTHMTLHTGKTVQCPDCDKKFSRVSFLVQHRREHTGDRPYACDRCPKRYRQQCHLSRHIDMHNGVRHACHVCGKQYSKQWSLKMHMFEHSGVRPYACTVCPATYVRRDKFRAHVQKHAAGGLSKELEC